MFRLSSGASATDNRPIVIWSERDR